MFCHPSGFCGRNAFAATVKQFNGHIIKLHSSSSSPRNVSYIIEFLIITLRCVVPSESAESLHGSHTQSYSTNTRRGNTSTKSCDLLPPFGLMQRSSAPFIRGRIYTQRNVCMQTTTHKTPPGGGKVGSVTLTGTMRITVLTRFRPQIKSRKRPDPFGSQQALESPLVSQQVLQLCWSSPTTEFNELTKCDSTHLCIFLRIHMYKCASVCSTCVSAH